MTIDETAGLKPWQLLRRAPAPVWIVTALFTVVLAAWSVLVPLYHASDEPNHVDAVMRLEEGRGWTSPRTATVQPEAVGAIAASPYGLAASPLTLNPGPIPQGQAVPRHDRPAWQDLKALPGTANALPQQLTQHPPGYYWYEAAVLRLGGAAGWRWDILVSTMRLLTVLLTMWIPLVAWATAWRVTGSRLAGLCAAILPLAVPQFTSVGSTVNNDALLALAGGATLLGLACAMRGDRSRGTAVWTAVWLTIALWTKAFALFLLPMVFLVYAAPWLRARWAARGATHGIRSWLPDRRSSGLLGLSLGAPLLLGLWFYIFNEAQWGSIAPSTPGFPAGRYLGHDFWLFAQFPTSGMMRRWWSDIGWFEFRIPWRLTLAASIISALLALYGVLRWRGRRISLVMLLWPTVVAYVVVMAGVTSYYFSTHYVRGVAGRYLYVGFVGAAVLVGAGCAALPRAVARWTPLALLLAAFGMQIETVHLAIDHWWRPVNGTLRQAWSAFSAWSSWPVGALYAGIAALGLFAVAAVAAMIRVGVTDRIGSGDAAPASSGVGAGAVAGAAPARTDSAPAAQPANAAEPVSAEAGGVPPEPGHADPPEALHRGSPH